MVTEKNLELLDLYVSNRMSVDEKAAFEKQLHADAELLQEFQLQQKVIEGLRQARVAELKNMFNNVPASALTGSSAAFIKATVGVVVTGIIATGIYFYLKPEVNKPQIPVAEEAKVESPEPTKAEEIQPGPETPIEAVPVEEKKFEKSAPKKITKKEKAAEPVAKPAIDVFEPEADLDSQATASTVAPIKEATAEKVTHGSIALGIDKTNKKYPFHYQFKDDSLLLFGPFEKNVYEIMEFFSDDNKRTIFLFYKDHYYFLKEDSEKIKPLKAISDPALIKKLRDSRKK